MAEHRFRPTVYPLEVRDVPAASGVTPQQVFDARGFVLQTPGILGYFEDNLDVARAGGAGPTLLAAADLNRGAAATLTGFLRDALEAAAANPAAAGTLNAVAGGAGVLIAQASANAAAAEALANRLGTFRPPPPQPPPTGDGNNSVLVPRPDQNPPTSPPVSPTTPVSPPTTPVPPADGSSLTQTIPNVNSPSFTAVGTEGLRTQDVRVGEGALATSNSRVQVRYIGFLVSDGTSFDDNTGANDPLLTATLGPVPTVIQGFAQGVTGMRVGGIRNIDIPSELGYGEQGTTGIPPNARLLFQVQLVEVLT
jgi:hypothetical protein